MFLQRLKVELAGRAPEDIESIIQDYEAYFHEAEQKGLPEEEVIRQLGMPQDIVDNIRKNEHHQPGPTVIKAILLIFFNLAIMLPLFATGIALFMGLVVTVIVCIMSPLFSMMDLLMGYGERFNFFLSLLLSGVGLLLSPYGINIFKKIPPFVNRYYKWNLKILRGERDAS